MKHYDRTPNVFLRRTQFYRDCTLGTLTNENGELICYTLEPPYRAPDERPVVGQTAIPNGTYPLKMEYDTALRYKCLRVGEVRGFKNARLCFLTKTKATPTQTRCHILLGTQMDEVDGCLTNCVTAFEALLAYYEEKRCNHSQLCLQISCDNFNGRQHESFGKSIEDDISKMPDYMLETM